MENLNEYGKRNIMGIIESIASYEQSRRRSEFLLLPCFDDRAMSDKPSNIYMENLNEVGCGIRAGHNVGWYDFDSAIDFFTDRSGKISDGMRPALEPCFDDRDMSERDSDDKIKALTWLLEKAKREAGHHHDIIYEKNQEIRRLKGLLGRDEKLERLEKAYTDAESYANAVHANAVHAAADTADASDAAADAVYAAKKELEDYKKRIGHE